MPRKTKTNRPVFEERRADILEAAIEVFATLGYHKVTTADVSKVAGISQPYIYRFFDTKEALFLEVIQLVYDRIYREFEKIHGKKATLLEDLIRAYEDLMKKYPNEILLQIQTWGIAEENIQKLVKKSIVRLKEQVKTKFENAGFKDSENQAKDFLARGFLCNLAFALHAPELTYQRKG
ncbi:transcriptional regulator, TetR family [Leptospira broomii serovar Hurstbridge str. 5399]|uniref:Transcriptional regulator, TetR family n=1 Tax=Leptospira broomii serovar Hurstbridge str. 5399 TaxID=1049789 RepID=T0GNC6_9LEPT|nr:TetR/AcrR family transcriptional regulator [Leptospira broomii]EQA46843.1 transcriptional regulator, TetR family [Leptospira broomii serovar Hurstbridge str. 5399]